jgi:diguanylate cyclase (GGDEF)-like protein
VILNSFKNKVILPVAAVLVALTSLLTVFTTVEFLSYSDTLTSEKIAANAKALRFYLNKCNSYSKVAAISTSDDKELAEAVKARDRREIIRILTPMLELYQVNFFTVTDEHGAILARTHEPDNFGDTIINQRNIRNAADGKITTHFEAGTRVKVSVRTGAPIYDEEGALVGIVSAGIRFDTDEVVDELKDIFLSDVSVFFGDTRITTTVIIDGRRITGMKMDPAVAKAVLEEKTEYSKNVDILGVKYKTFYMPVLNESGEAFAAFFIGAPLAELKAASDTLVRNIIAISLLGLAVSIIIMYQIVSSVSRPLIQLSKNVNEIENGNFNISIDTKQSDEVGNVSRSLQKLVHTVRELINGINTTISENQKGKAYSIDTKAFRGAYQTLAERIVELSDFSTKDKLTGLANRRTFDFRLNLEWNRAMRDSTPLSLLILDVDRFKNFNDTYGHQQGDTVLQMVADTLTQSIKRGIDFVARWGGEEFVVLLPNTSTNGAMHVAEKIRARVEEAEIKCANSETPRKVTISIGVSTQTPATGSPIDNLISKADEALYSAKNAGRNRVCLSLSR